VNVNFRTADPTGRRMQLANDIAETAKRNGYLTLSLRSSVFPGLDMKHDILEAVDAFTKYD
jgi:hypothetical protein